MKLFLKNEKGMTLVELVVTLLLMSIALGSIGAIIPMVQKHYARAEGISYKQGTVTDVETRLQNALGRGTFLFIRDTPNGDYNLGFNEKGQCVEVTKDVTGEDGVKAETVTEVEVGLDQISEIKLRVFGAKEGEKIPETYTMGYELIPKDTTMSDLVGGTVMNNIVVGGTYKEAVFMDDVTLNSASPKKYLVIDFDKKRDPVPRTLYERMLKTYHDFFDIYNKKPKPDEQEFAAAGFVKADGKPGFFSSNDVFSNRLFDKWYADEEGLPVFDPSKYVYASDNETVPKYMTGFNDTRYVTPYIIESIIWDPEYDKNPQIFLFAGRAQTCKFGDKNWPTSFIFFTDTDKETGEVFGHWYYNKVDKEVSYLSQNQESFAKLKEDILKNTGGKWEKLILKE